MNIKFLLTTCIITISICSFAQITNKTYAITGDGNHDFMWMNIRQVNIGTGKIEQDIYQREKTAFIMIDADSKSLLKALKLWLQLRHTIKIKTNYFIHPCLLANYAGLI